LSGLVIDNFAGGGGASLGMSWALGRSPDVAINHDEEAVALHAANHPETLHLCQSVWRADPQDVTAGRPVALAWFSPDCKHFSKAKGGKPVEKHIRDLAWVVVHWARRVKPAVIMLENVEEFRDWGPLISTEDGKLVPCPARKGLTFRRWVHELKREGYAVEWRALRGCDYGAPTIRKRLFLIARCDGLPIVWPVPTHGPGRAKPWLSAAEIIDWSLPCPSIFLTREEGRAIGVHRPLVEATMRRIALGVKRYVLDSPRPFIVPITHHGSDRAHAIEEPVRTVTTANRGELALVSPSLVQCGYGERTGQAPRAVDIGAPLGTVVAGGRKHALVAAFLAQHNTGVIARSAVDPVSTITARGTNQALVSAGLIQMKGSNRRDRAIDLPISAVTAQGCHLGEVRAFLVKYFGTDQDPRLHEPLHTVTTKHRFGLVMIEGEPYAIADIGMRMLSPRELYRAQGFPDSYRIDITMPNARPLTKTAQIRMCGNSVNPQIAEALVRANLPALCTDREAA
jgi:DNA (cytosine-5)-methyltransferase 1